MNINAGQKDKDIAVLEEMHKRYEALKQKADEQFDEISNAGYDVDEVDRDELELTCNILDSIVNSLCDIINELTSL